MLDTLLSFLAPHYCYGCGKTGTLLCANCKYNIVSEPFEGCVLCGLLTGKGGVCSACSTHCQRAWCIGERHDTLKQLIDGLKFERKYNAFITLADLLTEQLPVLPDTVIIVPIPTISPHVRERGYDQTALIATRIGRTLHHPVKKVLYRKTTTRQLGGSKREREQRAKAAFGSKKADSSCIYLLVDDVVTTGATLRYAAQALREAGAETIWAAVAARQPLD